VLSELRRAQPDANVVRWFAQRPAELLYLSLLTLGEIRKGVELRPPDTRRVALQEWLGTELPRFFRGRILGIDAVTAERWGRVTALAGRPVPTVDGLLAATALQHDLVLVTRNVRDFAGLGVRLLNPWDA
jgi:predicted nucleic acid-binding protein